MNLAPDLEGRISSVVEGRTGRLFLESAPGFEARTLHAGFHGDLEALWGRPLDRMKRLCAEIGARLVLLLPPDAHGVHREELPDGLGYATPSILDAVAELARARDVPVVALGETLRQARGPVEVFRRTDSHWSGFGAYIAYRELMAAIPECGAAIVPPEAVQYEWRWEAGDLGAGLDPPRRAPVAVTRLHQRAHAVFEAMNAQRHAIKITEHPDRGLPRAVMVRDSYASEIAPFLAESFRRIAFVGAGSVVFEDFIREERPQVVIVERAERCLPYGLYASDPFGDWREHWPPPGDGAGEAEAREQELRAGRALLAGDGAQAVEAAEAACLLGATPDRFGLLARAREVVGAEDLGDAWWAAASAEPERFAFVMRLGLAHLRAGREGPAREAFARACALRPWSGAAYEHLGYAAMRLEDGELARYALERAVAVDPERAGAWLWLGGVHAARGHPAAALEAYDRGLLAAPGDPGLLAARAAAAQGG